MRRLAGVIGCWLLVLGASFAQEDATWPPDPATIFAPGVEIVSTEVFDPQTDYVPQMDRDDTSRLFYIVDLVTGQRRDYPYPDEIASLSFPSEQEDGTLFFSVKEYTSSTDITQSWVWFLDPVTGVFSRYTARCGQKPPLYLPDVEEVNWVLLTDSDNGNQYLCETATSERSPALPTGWQWGDVSDSPNGDWVVIFAWLPDEAYQFSVFSYEIATRSLRNLGSFFPEYNVFFDEWVDSQVLIRTSEMPEWSVRYIYIADASRSDSLELAVTRFRFWPEYYDDPPRYEFVRGIEGGDGPHGCTWVIYDIRQRLITYYDLSTMCLPEIGHLSETAYYRDIGQYGTPQSILVRFNAITGERKDLFTGEIEAVIWVSADEHYAILSLGNDGDIDTVHYFQEDTWGDLRSANLSYVDLFTGETLFSIPGGWEFDGSWFITSSIRPQSDGTFLAIAFADYHREGYASLFSEVDGEYVEKRLVNNVVVNMGRYLIFWVDGKTVSTRLSIYDTQTGTTTPFVQDVDLQNYDFELSDVYNGQIKIIVKARFGYPHRSVRYLIDIPQSAD